jgi:hypothetical protein
MVKPSTMLRTTLLRSAQLLAVFILPSLVRAADEKPIKSTIDQVTVFLSGAYVQRTATVELPKGSTRLVFKELSEETDPASVQVSGTGAFTILSVKHRSAYAEGPEGTAEVKALEASIKTIERDIQDEQNRIGVLQNEEQRLLKNEGFEGGDQGLSVERIKAINDYYRERITAIREGILAKQRRITERTEEVQRLRLDLGQLQGRKAKAYSEVVVEVAAERALTSTMTLRYAVRSAGWSPQYDIRVGKLDGPFDLVYKASVFQSTGEDWKDVKLELASGDPQHGGVMPQLAVWRLSAGRQPAVVSRTPRPYDAAIRDVRGIVRDARTGEPLPFVNIAVMTADGTTLNGTTSNFDGYYALAIPAGGRALQFSYVGYRNQRTDIHNSTMNMALEQAIELKEFEVVQYSVPLIDRDGGASGTTVRSEDIRMMPGRSAASVATTREVQMRGARTELASYPVDVTGGVPANYGDVTGGIIASNDPEVTVRQRSTHFAFTITLPYSIPSDGQGHLVAVKEHKVPSVYRHYCIPKLDPAAYLFAKATGWDALDLLPGPANLYFEGTYIGETYLDSDQVTDTLDISLGRDRGVVVQRTKEQDFSRRQVTGNKRSETIAWTIDLRNTKSEPIDLVLMDQVPVPMLNDINVHLVRHDATSVDEQRGFLTWRVEMAPRAAEQRSFAYEVKAPKGMPLVLE